MGPCLLCHILLAIFLYLVPVSQLLSYLVLGTKPNRMLEPEKKEVKREEWGHWFCWMTNHPEVSVVAYISNLSTKEAEVKANVAIIVRICLKKLLKM